MKKNIFSVFQNNDSDEESSADKKPEQPKPTKKEARAEDQQKRESYGDKSPKEVPVSHASAIESAQATIVRWKVTGPRPDPARRVAIFGTRPRGRWPEPRRPVAWVLRAGVEEGRSSRDGSRLFALSLHSGCPCARHPFGAGLNPTKRAQRFALGRVFWFRLRCAG